MSCSDPSGGSNEVPNLMNFEEASSTVARQEKRSVADEYDPLKNDGWVGTPTRRLGGVVSTTSMDSLFSDTFNSMTTTTSGGGFSLSPDTNQTSPRGSLTASTTVVRSNKPLPLSDQAFMHQSSIPARSSTCPSPSVVRPRPRSAHNSVDPTDNISAPSSRAMTPKLSRSSPSGSVHSLPPKFNAFHEADINDFYPFFSDSSNNSSLYEFSMFDDTADDDGLTMINLESFSPPSLQPTIPPS